MREFFDELETRDAQTRDAQTLAAIAAQVGHAAKNAPAYAEILAGADPRALTSFDALAELPLTRKSEVARLQRAAPPFGGLSARRPGELQYLFASPGPIYEPAAARADYWRFARALFAAGFRAGDVAQCCFSYHLTPAGAMGDSGCRALGCAVIPAGTGQSEQQAQTMADLKADGYIGTPSFLRIILEKADETGADVSALRKALLSGEALPPALRGEFAARGIGALQCYATADLGLIAYESRADDGLIIDEGVHVEIVSPDGAPLPDFETGEVVVTTLNPDYPLIRFATGDLSAFMPGQSECGRTNRRLRGWLGRADQTAKVRGMFIHPSQITQALQRHPEIARARLVIDWHEQRDRMTLHCEPKPGARADDALAAAVATSIREICKVRGEVQWAKRGALADDGKVIDDIRDYRNEQTGK
ncbi:MAG: AMP-binding protein [Gammaproteobacteria bacterium]|nr:AMP-binding protein [Gammaproteobacteria bacterium]